MFGFGKKRGEVKKDVKKEQMFDVRIVGCLQANGPITVNRVIRLDRAAAGLFQNAKTRQAAIDGWLSANYPGARRSPSSPHFTATVSPAKD